MKKKEGFTLIELLAVIVVLVIIVLISVPILLNVIDSSKKGALQDSAYGIIESGELYYAQNLKSNSDVTRYDFEVKNGQFVDSLDNTKKLSFKGLMPKTGTLQINGNGKTAVAICTDKYCACKSVSELKVTVKDTNCNINNETGNIENTIDGSKGSDSTPVGIVISYMGNNAPTGYLKCDGQIYNISEYQTLANQIKEEFGNYNYYGGDGTNTFAVPNLQGEFLRGYTSDSTKSATTGINTSEIGKHQDGTVMPSVYHWGNTFGILLNTNSSNDFNSRVTYADKIVNTEKYYASVGTSFVSQVVNSQGDYLSRPTNTSVLYCIKY